jgi:hypothetical protein
MNPSGETFGPDLISELSSPQNDVLQEVQQDREDPDMYTLADQLHPYDPFQALVRRLQGRR